MPPRRQMAKAGQKHEMEAFAEKYDTLVLMYGDPVEAVFAILERNVKPVLRPDGTLLFGDDDVALRAADMLLSYRYPRVKAAEGNQARAPVLNFNVSMAPAALPVDVTPRKPVLAITGKSK